MTSLSVEKGVEGGVRMIHMTNEQTNDATHLALYMFLHLVRVWAKHYRHSRYMIPYKYRNGI